ncbi:MAG TPA: patatin-like phospholipase family protein [Usitatibacter sp.]|nr:patatin-like phospholipase family protein [Usitatibacter sp.]
MLGGGGARGGAHIGVLEVLEQLRIPVDCVAGTSMGALVAGAYVSGVSPEDMRAKIGATDWSQMFNDSASREFLTYRRRELDDRFIPGSEFGVTPEGMKYREGAVAGEKVKLFFGELVRADLGERNIEELPLPLTLIATDIVTGERVAMRSGNLTSAMRASMSVPGALAPIVREGHKLVDGGLVDNVPIQEVRDRCGAQVVIAVNVGSPLMREDQVSGVVSVVGQMVNLLTEQNVSKSLALLKPTDVYMRPELGDITAASFDKQLEAAEIGKRTALEQVEKLRKLSVSPEEYRAWKSKLHLSPSPAPPVVDELRIAETRFVNPQELRSNIHQKEGEPLDSKKLGSDLLLIYSNGDLQTLDYSVLRERDKTILQVTPIEKSWGPDYLRFGLNLATDVQTESQFNIRALYRKTWINSFGGEFLTIFQVGQEQALGFEWYQPVTYRQDWFVRPYAGIASHVAGVYFNGDRAADYLVRESNAGVDFGARLGTYGQAKVGWIERKERASLETGSPLLPNADFRVGGLTGNLDIDQYDLPYFPTSGYKVKVVYFDAMNVAEVQKYGRLEGRVSGATSIRDIILRANFEAGRATHGNLPVGDMFGLGGFGRLSAFATNQIIGQNYDLGTAQIEYRLLRPLPLFGITASAGATYERGRMKDSPTEPSLTGWLDSYGVYFGANTPIGPLVIGYSDSKSTKGRFYIYIGTP